MRRRTFDLKISRVGRWVLGAGVHVRVRVRVRVRARRLAASAQGCGSCDFSDYDAEIWHPGSSRLQ